MSKKYTCLPTGLGAKALPFTEMAAGRARCCRSRAGRLLKAQRALKSVQDTQKLKVHTNRSVGCRAKKKSLKKARKRPGMIQKNLKCMKLLKYMMAMKEKKLQARII